jgi:hypothetical protein
MVQAVPRRGALPRPGGCSAFRPGGPGGLRGKPTRAPNWGASFFFAAPPAHRGGAVRQPAPVCNIDSVSWCDGESQRAPHVHRCRPTCKGAPNCGAPLPRGGWLPKGAPNWGAPLHTADPRGRISRGRISLFEHLSAALQGDPRIPQTGSLKGAPGSQGSHWGSNVYTYIYK